MGLHVHPKPWSFPLLHFFGYPDYLCLAVLCGTDVMVEIGTDMWLVGYIFDMDVDSKGQIINYPTAEYEIDGISSESPSVTLLVRH
jgi:hypothetical protein